MLSLKLEPPREHIFLLVKVGIVRCRSDADLGGVVDAAPLLDFLLVREHADHGLMGRLQPKVAVIPSPWKGALRYSPTLDRCNHGWTVSDGSHDVGFSPNIRQS